MNYSFIKKAFAHSGEEHESTVEATAHYLDFLQDPFIAIILLFIILTLIYLILDKLKVNFFNILLSLVVVDFILGVLGFIFVPPMGIIAISIGFAMSIFLVLAGVSSK